MIFSRPKKETLFIKLCFCLLLFNACKETKKEAILPKKDQKRIELNMSGRNNLALTLYISNPTYKSTSANFTVSTKQLGQKTDWKDSSWTVKNLEGGLTTFLKYIHDLPFEAPANANCAWKNNQFIVNKEINGAQLDTSALRLEVRKILLGNSTINKLDLSNFYLQPKYTSTSPELVEAKKNFEKSLNCVVNIEVGEESYTLDKDVFGTWLSLDKNLKVSVDNESIQIFLEKIIQKIETPMADVLAKIDLNDTTINYNNIKFERVDIYKEIDVISSLIIAGKTTDKIISTTSTSLPQAFKKGIKNFIEVSISQQKLWLFKNGSLLLETDVVTGNKKLKRDTPIGDYKILAKVRNKTLRGRGYASFVSYWMPFHGGYGLHDARWRSRFGSSIFQSSGSHGCVNIPPKNASIVYENVEVGMPVIIH